MSLSLAEYADLLDGRNLIWPQVPPPKSVNATPALQPLSGIRAVLWDVYGTLLRITDGQFTLFPTEEVRLQIALDKTIREFNMWNHMYRKPGPPWQSMIGLYRSTIDRLSMVGAGRGDVTEVHLVDVWQEIIERLFEKDYTFDQSVYGDLAAFSEKVAYFFHCNLQGTEARDGAVRVMRDLAALQIQQGFLSNGQSFTLVQSLRALARQGELPPLYELFRPQTLVLSTDVGAKKPSRSLFARAVSNLRELGISPDQILHVSCRLETDLVPAKAAGMKTALLAAEKSGLQVSDRLLKDPATRPDRLLTDLSQLSRLLMP